MSPLIETISLKVGYNASAAFACPDFAIYPGDVLKIAGGNGAGKTTLVKTLTGLIPPISGEIRSSERLKKLGAGYVPQSGPLHKDFPASVMEVVLSGFQSSRGFRPFHTLGEKRRARKILERMGISEIARSSYRELSGGQRQRLLIARALVSAHPVIFLDEPANALDQDAAARLREELAALAGRGIAVAIVTHSPHDSLPYSAVLKLGESPSFERRNAHA